MESKSLVCFFLATFVVLSGQSARAYHCSNVLTIETAGLLNHLGNVTFTAPENHTGQWKLMMKTDLPFTFIGGWRIWVQSDSDQGTATFQSRDTDLEILEGETVTMRYRMSWARHAKTPTVISLLWNGHQLCR